MIKGIIYDWGGVICVDPAPHFLTICSKVLNTTPQKLKPLLLSHMDNFQKGSITESAVWKNVSKKLNLVDYNYTRPLWRPAFESFYQPQQEVINSAKELGSHGFVIGFLTNTEKPAMEFNQTLNYDFFDAKVYSCEEGIIKPDPAIYTLIANRMGLSPEECIMVDDKKENIIGAENIGMKGILFTTFSDYQTQIKNLCTF